MDSNRGTASDGNAARSQDASPPPPAAKPEPDEFGLPQRHYPSPAPESTSTAPESTAQAPETSLETPVADKKEPVPLDQRPPPPEASDSDSDDASFDDAPSSLPRHSAAPSPPPSITRPPPARADDAVSGPDESPSRPSAEPVPEPAPKSVPEPVLEPVPDKRAAAPSATNLTQESPAGKETANASHTPETSSHSTPVKGGTSKSAPGHGGNTALAAGVSSGPGVSEFSHQQVSMQPEAEAENEDAGWQTMPAFARYDMYDDDDRLIAREQDEAADLDEKYAYGGLGGAGRGYTRVIMDEDAESATSMDENTKYLFTEANGTSMMGEDEGRDAVSQMQATKDLLTEGQRIAYVGLVRLEIANLVKEADDIEVTRKVKKEIRTAAEAVKMWGQKMMIRVYSHMEISEAEQIMIEQLADHGVVPRDLTAALHANSRVQNPMASDSKEAASQEDLTSPTAVEEEAAAEPPPPYAVADSSEVPEVQTPSQLPTTQKIDIDLRWTVLCDLFLLLIADSVYDARSRVLLERVGASLDITWIDICKFEKRITDALEMQQAAEKENWNEDEHMDTRAKMAQKRRYVMMGLATVGGGLVIGLSAGLLAPVIGAGLAAGFTTIGVTGTSSFLAGAGGAAIITSGAAASGSIIGGRAANRRTGAVKTFEYRPLHNKKRVNLIVTVSGWLTGKVDDVRLPFSTVDPVMGDIYSVLWEPEMLRSMGDTINILATEALTQGLQQILGSTILVSLMAALQLPIVLTKLSYLIDNPWAVSLDRATAAGLILADSLIERSLGTRPITLVGYSLGARVIFSCLQELAKKGAYGLVQNVYLFGSPVVVKKEEYLRARTVVSGRFVNGFNRNDWILGYLFRLTNGGIRRVAGLAAIEDCPWIENMDVSELVPGHMEYRKAMPTLLIKCGWTVESEEFTEIEDPDPENHQERQRELINEIEEARKELEKEGKAKKGGKFSLFGRRKKAERQEWEVYEDSAGKEAGKGVTSPGVLFDVDAIRAELAKDAQDGAAEEALQVKEIKSTLPPMKLDISPTTEGDGRGSLRVTKSADAIPLRRASQASSWHEPSPAGGGMAGSAGVGDEEEMQMTFDTSFTDPAPSGEDFARPTLKTSQTAPNVGMTEAGLDPDDDDFGQEREISMTFA